MDNCPHCQQRLVWCRVCSKYVCERAREFNEPRAPDAPFWRCESPSWCTHIEGYSKRSRFTVLTDHGNYRIRDDETGSELAFDNDVRKEWTLLSILNQLAFELDVLKRHHVKETE